MPLLIPSTAEKMQLGYSFSDGVHIKSAVILKLKSQRQSTIEMKSPTSSVMTISTIDTCMCCSLTDDCQRQEDEAPKHQRIVGLV